MNPSLFGAGGEMISTTGDLGRFFAALLGGRLLPGPLLGEMRTPAYQSWTLSTEDRRRQVTVAVTPDFRADPDDAVDAFLDTAFCR